MSENFTDPRDGKVYRTVKIGNQVWMAENLNYEAEGSKCYNNDPANGQKYGRLYDWYAAKKACPSGWHLPSNAEWDVLCRFVDGSSSTESPCLSGFAGKYLKAKSGWNTYNGMSGNGEDTYGFAALPGGVFADGGFLRTGTHAYWWCSNEYDTNRAYLRGMREINTYVIHYNIDKTILAYVRCLQD